MILRFACSGYQSRVAWPNWQNSKSPFMLVSRYRDFIMEWIGMLLRRVIQADSLSSVARSRFAVNSEGLTVGIGFCIARHTSSLAEPVVFRQ